MKSETKIIKLFSTHKPLQLECGISLPEISVAFHSYGQLNAAGTNAILVCHALTGDSHVAGKVFQSEALVSRAPFLAFKKPGDKGWWEGLIGQDLLFDPSKYFIICSNILGSCYGTTGPSSTNPETGKKYGITFPQITVRDMVKVQNALLSNLGVKKLITVIGGSLGGMQVLEWALMYPKMVKSIIPIATASRHSDWCISLNSVARHAIMNDPQWQGGEYHKQPEEGLALARKISMISYRSDLIFNQRFRRERLSNNGKLFDAENIFQVENYLNYQGLKLVRRFDANTYLYLSRAMDLHDVSRGRSDLQETLGRITAKTLCIGIDTDVLYPAHEQQRICRNIPTAEYAEITSAFGHDAFLVEITQLTQLVKPFIETVN